VVDLKDPYPDWRIRGGNDLGLGTVLRSQSQSLSTFLGLPLMESGTDVEWHRHHNKLINLVVAVKGGAQKYLAEVEAATQASWSEDPFALGGE
jgi:hypothetical protein